MAVMEAVALLAPSPAGAHRRAATALFVERLDADIVGCAARLMRLVDTPEAIPVVRPAVMQELHYWLLSSRHGPALRRLALPDGTACRIARAIEVLGADFREPLPVARLAATATMSTSAFHRHSAASPRCLRRKRQLRADHLSPTGDNLRQVSQRPDIRPRGGVSIDSTMRHACIAVESPGRGCRRRSRARTSR